MKFNLSFLRIHSPGTRKMRTGTCLIIAFCKKKIDSLLIYLVFGDKNLRTCYFKMIFGNAFEFDLLLGKNKISLTQNFAVYIIF